MSKQNKFLADRTFRDGNYYNLKFLTAAESDFYHSQLARHEVDPSIEAKQKYLDYYYLGEKLKDVCEMKIRRGILKVDYTNQLFEVLIQQIENNMKDYEKVPSIIVYYHLYLLISEKSPTQYRRTLEVVELNELFLPHRELQNIYNHLQNYCIEQINNGNSNFLNASFDLYKKLLEKELLMDDSYYLFEWHYKNIVTIVMRLGETNWVKNFIETYRDHLHPNVAQNAYAFNLATYYYGTDQLEKIQDLLLQVSSKDHRYFMAAKALLIRTYYDMEEHEALYSLVRSFGTYLKRNKLIPDNRRTAFLNLLKFTQKCAQIKAKIGFESKTRSKAKVEKLIESVSLSTDLINKTWLEQKLGEIEV